MSTEVTVAADDEVCASCGIAANDDVKLKNCACNLVKYCSVACQKNHRQQHKKLCRKRLAELRDIDLFTQPDGTHWGECPICCLPLPLDPQTSDMAPCCNKMICIGCSYANAMREFEEGREQRCAFCREPVPKSEEEADKQCMKRVKKNDPTAMVQMGEKLRREGDYESAFGYFTKAAGLGDADAHHNLSCLYQDGEGVEMDAQKQVFHLEEAAMAGHHMARHNLGCIDAKSGRFERAVKHFTIAANLGYHDSLKILMMLHAEGRASKEQYSAALRAYQAAVDEMKSAEREEAEKAKKRGDVTIF
jgi:TPR repeat protein